MNEPCLSFKDIEPLLITDMGVKEQVKWLTKLVKSRNKNG